MTQQEKAFELAHKFRLLEIRTGQNSHMMISMECAKQCAIIAVDEIIASNPIAFDEDDNCIEKQWWKEVKKEIEKL
jgi:hypothetical protein